jgi:hypothetical protein
MTRNIGKEMIDGLNELADTMQRGEDLAARIKVRDSRSRMPSPASGADENARSQSHSGQGEQQA